MKQTSTTKTSATSEDEAPALSQANFDRAGFRIGKQKVSRSEWQTAVRARVAKQRISIMLDAPIIARYKAIAGERGYQTLINDTLRRAVEGEHFVQDMRNAIREELAEYEVSKRRDKSPREKSPR
jgi:uncharacterized protein (DUF4415 family)